MIFGEVQGGIVVNVLNASQSLIDTLPTPSDWYELPYGVWLGWTYSAGVWTGPEGQDPGTPSAKEGDYLLTGPEWVERFTRAEWKWIKSKRAENTNAGERLDQMMDSIRWLNAVNVAAGGSIDEFYTWLLDQGIPGGQGRIDELRAPVS